ncbi:MAG: SDR family NAD(P)-dependent oxidoreductase, partial [Promethearchaeota archaeon]
IVNDPDNANLDLITAPVAEKFNMDTTIKMIETDEGPIAKMELIEKIIEKYEKINGIIINHDNFKIAKNRIEKYAPEDFDKIIEENVYPYFHFAAAIRNHFRKRQGTDELATMLMMTSIVAKSGMSAGSLYAAAKGAINGMIRSLAKEFGRFATVNGIAQGFYAVKKGAVGPRDREKGNFMITKTARSDQPLMPEDVARIAAYLVSKDAKMISGQIYNVDGGLWLNVES